MIGIRHEVFVVEQEVPIEIELDGVDPDCQHLLAFDPRGRSIGTARMQANGYIGRIAVVKPWRKRSVGAQLVEVLVDDQPSSHAVTFDPEIHPVSISSRTVPDRDGAFVYRHRGVDAIEDTPTNPPLDERIKRQLRSLGYIR